VGKGLSKLALSNYIDNIAKIEIINCKNLTISTVEISKEKLIFNIGPPKSK